MTQRFITLGLVCFGLVLPLMLHPRNEALKPLRFQPRPPLVMPVLPSIEVNAEMIHPAIPVSIQIPAIRMQSEIVPMGLTPENIVDTPRDAVGWYKDGAKPGEIGMAAFNGHVQKIGGQPGVFAKLAQLKLNDDIFITDTQHQQFHYRVTKSELVSRDLFPVGEVYGATDKATISIVTCAGSFDRQLQDFTKRTIVYAALID